MRKWVLAAALIAVAALAYGAWPFVGMAQLAHAVHSRNVDDILERVDVSAVRRSLLTQILDEATRGTDASRKLGHFGRRAAVGLLQSSLDAEFARLLGDDGLRTILAEGRLPSAMENDLPSNEPTRGPQGLRFARLAESPLRYLQGWRFRSLITFEATIGKAESPNEWVTLRLRREGPVWRLTSIELPRNILERLKPLVQKKLGEMGM